LELLPVDQLKANFEKFGISDDSRIVVYFGNDWASPSTRIIWTLTYMGLGDRTSLLEGGMIAWKAAGLPVTTEVKAPSPGHLTPRVHPEVLVDAAWVSSHLHQPSVALIDVRTPKSYTGESEVRMPRAGHIPGAQNIPIEAMFDAHDNLIDKSAITELFRAAGVKPGSQVVSYCYVGQRATLIWFLARMLGYNASLYDGSWDEWSKRTDLPVETSNSTKQ
jgi:thiosulfate/3-mercaptopyruvate sulfurtransferase